MLQQVRHVTLFIDKPEHRCLSSGSMRLIIDCELAWGFACVHSSPGRWCCSSVNTSFTSVLLAIALISGSFPISSW